MKKLVIITTVPLTVSSFLMEQLSFLSAHYKIWVISGGIFPKIERLDAMSVNYVKLDMKRSVSPFSDMLSVIKLRKILKDIKPDIVHSFTPKAGLIGMTASFMARVPNRVHTFTGLLFPTKHGLAKHVFRWVDMLICYCATHPLAEGLGVKQDLFKGKITSKNIDIIGFGNIAGVNVSYFSKNQFLKDLDDGKAKIIYKKISPKEFVFCYVGRFTKDKGIEELVDAFEKLPSDCRLLLAGEQDERAPLSTQLIERIEANPHIFILGWLEDVRGVFYSSDVFVLPSYREGFPNTPLQASSMGVPSIVTDICGSNEIIKDELNGFLVSPRSKHSLLAGMEKAHQNRESLCQLGINARQVIVEKFEQNEHHQNVLSFYTRVAS